MENFFLDLSIILIIGAVVSIVFSYLKQPPVMAYLLTGIIVVQFLTLNTESKNSLEILSKIGITLPLFVLGLEFKILDLRSIGKTAVIAGVSQIFLGTTLGFLICMLLGFSSTVSIILAFALTFSSTIIVVKILSDKKDVSSLHGKIAIGSVLVQDIFAILVLIFLSAFNHGQQPDLNTFMLVLVKILVLLGITFAFSQIIFPRAIHSLSKSSELLFVASLAWAFGLASLVSSPLMGFSIEIGGFLAGLALANTTESSQIIAKVKSLRDFFLILYFVVLGMSLNVTIVGELILPAIIISLLIIILKPITVMGILGFLGYKSRTSLLTGFSLAQASEFSLVLVILAHEIGKVESNIIVLVTLVIVITFSISSMLMNNGDYIYDRIVNYLKVFERHDKQLEVYTSTKDLDNHIVLLGADRMGRSMLRTLSDQKDDILVMDFNPDITQKLKDEGFNVIFGDIADEDILQKAKIENARIILSTISDFEDNIILLTYLKGQLKNKERKPIIMVTAHLDSDRTELLEAGASYVIRPYQSAGKYIGALIKSGQIEELV